MRSTFEQLADLSELKPGWLDGDGEAVGIDTLWQCIGVLQFLECKYPELPLAHLYPTPEGNIQAEWDTPIYGVGLVFNGASVEGNAYYMVDTKRDDYDLAMSGNSAEFTADWVNMVLTATTPLKLFEATMKVLGEER